LHICFLCTLNCETKTLEAIHFGLTRKTSDSWIIQLRQKIIKLEKWDTFCNVHDSIYRQNKLLISFKLGPKNVGAKRKRKNVAAKRKWKKKMWKQFVCTFSRQISFLRRPDSITTNGVHCSQIWWTNWMHLKNINRIKRRPLIFRELANTFCKSIETF
jgi:hypothetical protein